MLWLRNAVKAFKSLSHWKQAEMYSLFVAMVVSSGVCIFTVSPMAGAVALTTLAALIRSFPHTS